MISEMELSNAVVGYKQARKALIESKAKKIYLADDCDNTINSAISALCSEKNIELIHVSTMTELGSICGIEVKASCAAIL